jgi:hypothetical protein
MLAVFLPTRLAAVAVWISTWPSWKTSNMCPCIPVSRTAMVAPNKSSSWAKSATINFSPSGARKMFLIRVASWVCRTPLLGTCWVLGSLQL